MQINNIKLSEYIANEQLVWQNWDGLIDFTPSVGFVEYDRAKREILSPKSYRLVSREQMLNTNFHDLAEWSRSENDVLLLGDDAVLICIPKSLFEKRFDNESMA